MWTKVPRDGMPERSEAGHRCALDRVGTGKGKGMLLNKGTLVGTEMPRKAPWWVLGHGHSQDKF